jgi:hypothetical protein
MKAWKLLAVIGGPFLLLFVLLYTILCPLPFLEMQAGYEDILQHPLPEGVKMVGERFNAFGRDRTIYDYCILLKGNPEALIAYTKLLGLSERKIPEDSRSNHILQVKLKWWTPPLLTMGSGCRFFERETDEHSIIQAELVGNELYLFKVGDIKSLEIHMQQKKEQGKDKKPNKARQGTAGRLPVCFVTLPPAVPAR